MTDFTFRPIGQWPVPFTKQRRKSPFGVGYNRTIKDLSREMDHLGVKLAVIQAAVSESELRLDGLLRAGARPQHPGIILAFESKKTGPMQMPCDTYFEWMDNLRAIGLSLTALRAIDRYGVTQRAEQYRGWSQLPPPGGIVTPPPMTVEAAAKVVVERVPGFAASDVIRNPENYRTAYREQAKRWHPDRNSGTQHPQWHTLQQAAVVLDRHFGL